MSECRPGLRGAPPAPNRQAVELAARIALPAGTPAAAERVLAFCRTLLAQPRDGDVRVEVVAFGSGLEALASGAASASLVQELAAAGVRFSACARPASKVVPLHPAVAPVPAGVLRLVELDRAGYSLIQP